MILSLLIGAAVGVLMFMLSWMASGLLNDGAKWLAQKLVHRRVQRLPERLRADYLESWLAEVEAMEAPTALLFAVLLYAPWSLRQELKPIDTVRPVKDGPTSLEDELAGRRPHAVTIVSSALDSADQHRAERERIRRLIFESPKPLLPISERAPGPTPPAQVQHLYRLVTTSTEFCAHGNTNRRGARINAPRAVTTTDVPL